MSCLLKLQKNRKQKTVSLSKKELSSLKG